MSKSIRKILFPGAAGYSLAATLDPPLSEPRAYALLAHCFTCSKDLRSIRELSSTLTDHGIAVLRFDFTGLGESEGDFSDTNFTSNLDDLVAAADFLRESYRPPRLLIGHSLGGAAVLASAARIPEALAVATLGAPSDPAHLRTSALADVTTDVDSAEISIAGRPFLIKRQLLDDLAQQNLLEAVAALRKALLILHSPIDSVVDIDHARRIYEAAKHPKSFLALDGADHLLLERPEDARYAGNLIACWADRYLPRSTDARGRAI